MAELTEKQLMILDTLVYLDVDYPPGTSMAELVTQLREPGGLDHLVFDEALTKKEAKELLDTIAADSKLMSLEIVDSKDTYVRAVCFADPSGDAVIAYRGTGGTYVAWDDNFQGGYLSDTDMQKEALEFAQGCAVKYDNITVTGHSKGGNMAQYVTVVMGDEVDRCVSFDGQGFSEDFIDKYEDEIKANQSKIRSVCSYNDYVNVLLTSIAGETVYLDNENSMFPGGHYIYDLITNENNQLNENGEYESARKRGFLAATADALETVLVGYFDSKGPLFEFAAYSIVGFAAGMLLGKKERSFKQALGEFFENVKDFFEYYVFNGLKGGKKMNVSVMVTTDALRDYHRTLSIVANRVDILRSQMLRVQRRMATNIIDGVAIGLPLQQVLWRLDSEEEDLRRLSKVLGEVSEEYEVAEQKVKAFAGGA